MDVEQQVYRVFIGGLFPSVTKDDLRDKFKSFGSVTDVELIQRKDDEGFVSKTFGYINLNTSNQQVQKCFGLFGATKWKGHELKVQLAKEDFMARLKKERSDPEYYEKKNISKRKSKIEPMKSYEDFLSKSSKMKRAVPGTLIEGERNWVIGKYGRPLPIVFIPQRIGKKPIKCDPSKHCHCVKRIADDTDLDIGLNELTWCLGEDITSHHMKLSGSRKEKRRKTSCKDLSDDGIVVEHKKKKRKKTSEVPSEDDLSDVPVKPPKKHSSKNNINGSETFDTSITKDNSNDRKKKSVKHAVDTLENNHLISETEQTENIDFETERTIIHNNKHTENVNFHTEMVVKNNRNKSDSDVESNSSTTAPNLNLSMSIIDQLLQGKEKQTTQKNNTSNVITDSSSEEENSDDNDVISSGNLFDFDFENLKQGNGKSNQNKQADVCLVGEQSDSESDLPSENREQETENLFDFEFENISNNKTASGLFSLDFTCSMKDEAEFEDSESNTECSGDENSGSSILSSDDSCEEENSSEKEMEMHENSQKHSPQIKKEVKEIQKSSKSNTKLSSKETEKKHVLSEEARTKSLEKRKKKSLQDKEAVTAALKNIDGPANVSNRFVFSDSGNEDEIDNKDKSDRSTESKTIKSRLEVGGERKSDDEEDSKSNNKTNLFDDSESELDGDDDDDDNNTFQLKTQFQGEDGQKLFKMQQRFGGDERFRMDKRFAGDIDDDEDSVKEEKKTNISEDEEEDELTMEKERNMNLLEQILQKPISMDKEKNRDKTFERYDPTSTDHENFEIKVAEKKKKKNTEGNVEEVELVQENTDEKSAAPIVSTEQFYAVDQSIKSLFNGSKQESQGFSFLGAEENTKLEEETVFPQKIVNEAKPELSWQKALEEMAKPMEIEMEDLNVTEEVIDTRIQSNFFFADDDERFERGERFKRTESIEEITNQWKELRSNLIQDYKKKHKDAIRRVRKLKERRFNKK